MGNYKFKLSDMMPNAWFYKLRDMSKPKKTHPVRKSLPSYPQRPSLSNPRHASFYHESQPDQLTTIDKFCTPPKFINTHFPKSSSKRKSIYNPSPKLSLTHCNCRLNSPRPPEPSFSSPDDPQFYGSHSCRITASSTDIIIDVNNGKSFSRKIDKFQYHDQPHSIPELTPILTKPIKPEVIISSELQQGIRDDQTRKKNKTKKKKRISSRSTMGIKLRTNSPRISSKKINHILDEGGRRTSVSSGKKQNLCKSFAIVKSSFDPQTDFKDSMVEMIIENNIRASKDLEELLSLYLSLNSDEYHDLIVKAFEQIWFDMSHLRL
ncbi:transcription repressor OFP4-like [Impatiens glandulifera]|uniref:transcription repressor OFP4-like n=1 Tax=Impatiens glandulifera TaxID=253017 RepID=UPI001FB07C4E|nr:transcription repressor OFP4-like [Impatiens glandulifera]